MESSPRAFLFRVHQMLLLLCGSRRLVSGKPPFTSACTEKLRGLSNEMGFSERKYGALTKDRYNMLRRQSMQRKEDWAGLGIKPLMIRFAHNLPANKKKSKTSYGKYTEYECTFSSPVTSIS